MFFALLVSCKGKSNWEEDIENDYPHGNGFTLQRFDVINTQLDSITQSVRDSFMSQDYLNSERVMILELILGGSELKFGLTSADKDRISVLHIFGWNKRIVGYTETNGNILIVLSNATHQVDLSIAFYKFIRPTADKKQFDYIYFPDDLYELTDESGIAPPPLLYCPYYYWYNYENGEFVYIGHEDE